MALFSNNKGEKMGVLVMVVLVFRCDRVWFPCDFGDLLTWFYGYV